MNQVQIQEEQEQEQMPIPMHFPRPGVDDSVGSLQFQLENDEIIGDVIRTLKRQVQVIDEQGLNLRIVLPNKLPYLVGQGDVLRGLPDICSRAD